MRSATHRVLVALLVLAMVLGNAPAAHAGSSVKVHIQNPKVPGVTSVKVALSDGTTATTLTLTDGETSGQWTVDDGGLYYTDMIVSVTVTFNTGTSQVFYPPSLIGKEAGGTLNIWLTGVQPPPTTGTVIVTKAKAAEGSEDFPTGSTFSVTLTGTGTDPEIYTLTGLTENGSVTFSDVAPGTYTISEGSLTAGFGTPTISPSSVTVEAGGSYPVTITNTYTAPPTTGTVIVTKVKAAEGSEDFPTGSTFSVTLTGTGTDPKSYTLTGLLENGSVTFSKVVPGTYTISEGSLTAGFGTPVYSQNSVTVEAGKEYPVTITNTYKTPPTTATIRVIKTVYDVPTDFDYSTPFQVTVAGTNEGNAYSETKLVIHGDDNYVDFVVVPGSYGVAETPVEGWQPAASIVVDSIKAGDVKVVRIPNRYIPMGSLTVKKTVDNTSDPYDADQVFDIIVQPPGEAEPLTASLKADESKTFDELAPGEYTITEGTEGLPSGWAWTNGVQTVTVLDRQTVQGEIINKYTAPRSTITVCKEIDGAPVDFDLETPFSVTLVGTNGYSSSKSVFGGGSVQFSDLLPGTYTVSEGPLGPAWNAPVFEQGDKEADQHIVVIPSDRAYDIEVTVTNSLTHVPLGDLMVTKVVDENSELGWPGDPVFRVAIAKAEVVPTLMALQTNGDEWPSADLAIDDTHKFEDLEPGLYNVFELPINFPSNWTSLTPVQTVEVTDGETTYVDVVNKYTAPDPELGSLTVTKYVDGQSDRNWPTNPAPVFRIYIEPAQMAPQVLNGEGNGDKWPMWADLEIGHPYTFADLEPGTYRVFEKANELPANWAPVSPEGVYVEVSKDQTPPVDVVNRFTAPQQFTLVISYKRWDTKAEIRDSISHTENKDEFREYPALFISGYHLDTAHSSSPFSYTFTEDGTHTFWYLPNETPPPPPPDTSLLTVYYKEWGTDDAVRAPTTHSGVVGLSQVINALEVEDYELREGQAASYTHVFTSGNGTYTFWYEMIIEDEEPPLAGTGGTSAAVMYGIGISLLGLGLATKKRRR